LPALPMLVMPPMVEKLELKITGDSTNILGFTCARYKLSQRGLTMEIWATDKLFSYQPYLQNQPSTFHSATIEERWPAMLAERKLFPLIVSLRHDNGSELFRFEVKSVEQKLIAGGK